MGPRGLGIESQGKEFTSAERKKPKTAEEMQSTHKVLRHSIVQAASIHQTSNPGSVKMRGVICALACIAFIQSSAAFNWEQCEGTAGKIDAVSLKPETPAPGTTVTFSIDATVGACKSLQSPKTMFLIKRCHMNNAGLL